MSGEHFDIEAFYAGEQTLIAEVYRRHYAKVERAVQRYCHGASADALIHEVFVSLLERESMRRSFKGGDIGAWLRTVAVNRAIDRLRRTQREVLTDTSQLAPSVDEALETRAAAARSDDIRFVQEALARYEKEHLPRLPKALQRAFVLLFVQKRSAPEIAEQLGVPRTTVTAWQSRLLERIGPYFRRLMAEGES